MRSGSFGTQAAIDSGRKSDGWSSKTDLHLPRLNESCDEASGMVQPKITNYVRSVMDSCIRSERGRVIERSHVGLSADTAYNVISHSAFCASKISGVKVGKRFVQPKYQRPRR